MAAGLDELILFLKRGFGMTILVVTHEMQSALRIGDRIALLHEVESSPWARARSSSKSFIREHASFSSEGPIPRRERRLTGSRPLSFGGFTMNLETKVGVFVIVSLLVLGATVYSVRTSQDVRGQVVYNDVPAPGRRHRPRHAGPVAGIRVGQVGSVRPSPADPTRSKSRSP